MSYRHVRELVSYSGIGCTNEDVGNKVLSGVFRGPLFAPSQFHPPSTSHFSCMSMQISDAAVGIAANNHAWRDGRHLRKLLHLVNMVTAVEVVLS